MRFKGVQGDALLQGMAVGDICVDGTETAFGTLAVP